MPNKENLINKGFDKNPNHINREGRPKKIYTILKEKGFCKDDILTAFGEIAFYNQKELVELVKDETKPVILRIVGNQFIAALKNNDYKKITEIMEHTIGKPLQKVEQSIDMTPKLNIQVSSNEISNEIQKLSNDND